MKQIFKNLLEKITSQKSLGKKIGLGALLALPLLITGIIVLVLFLTGNLRNNIEIPKKNSDVATAQKIPEETEIPDKKTAKSLDKKIKRINKWFR